ncbi:nuclear transport factor 2 family protein [Ciceribacter sp. L1K23]|uniref:nuclear transport factor 2 family protein n=1 Tax=Ciceribacter sp. L1K23 TaxID=2820276 RepID=UPI001B83099B|nr:nuclear transport factor 2 family protein [Ciceribacter sp. L1K23]MBR0555684.1 nuclear transport factor 2 family protein [Ciceribacter sp. L1K23]
MPFDPAEHVRIYHAAINALDFAAIEAFFAEDAVYLSPGTGDTVGRDAVLSAFRQYFETYPDQRAWDDAIETTGPRSARAVWNIEATHATTGERLSRRGTETVDFDSEGRIVRIEVEDRNP